MTTHRSGQSARRPRASMAFLAPLALALTTTAAAQQDVALEPIGVGQTVVAALTPASGVLEDGSHYHDYVIQLSAGDRVVVTLRSEDFDAFLHIGRSRGDDFETLAMDDDGAGGTDARVLWMAPEAGAFVIRANSLRSGETGQYVLTVEDAPPLRPVSDDDAIPVRPGDRHVGQLTSGDPVIEDGSHYHLFRLDATARERFVITLRSSDFDAYLSIGWADRGDFVGLASDDDGAGGTDARLEWTAPGTGTYLLRVNSLGAGETGAYTLLVESGPES